MISVVIVNEKNVKMLQPFMVEVICKRFLQLFLVGVRIFCTIRTINIECDGIIDVDEYTKYE